MLPTAVAARQVRRHAAKCGILRMLRRRNMVAGRAFSRAKLFDHLCEPS